MGEKDAPKSDGEKKADAGSAVVLKIDMHCEGCARKIKRSVRHFEGVESVKADVGGGKLTVTGKVDPAKLRDRVAEKTKQKVEIVSPQPKKDAAAAGGGGDKKPEEKKSDDKKPAGDKKPEEKKADDKKAVSASTVTLKIRLHCDECTDKIKRIISKIKGVESVTAESKKDLVMVKGSMDVKELTKLKDKLKRSVEVVPAKKENAPAKKADGGGEKKAKEGGGDKKENAPAKKADGGGEKKEKEGGGDKKENAPAKKADGGGDKKEGEAKAAGGGGGDATKKEEPKVEVNKMEYHGYHPQYSYYSAPALAYNHGYINEGYGDLVPQFNQGYANQGYGMDYPPSYPTHVVNYPPSYLPPYPTHAPQMFSDENPNACSVM
ncbi:heavy metal-associated isoprenylated plant protein 6-like [Cornus florida]|uniref:heavy metal-associated isoprenylated plant protein 6-like n=1 Tax=Cornus florida TaxID=4283 RepID=UPI00289C16B9|nr:heavy metal-associated isoprenylated plant protein 6-like [Cornus florida]